MVITASVGTGCSISVGWWAYGCLLQGALHCRTDVHIVVAQPSYE